MRGTALVPSAIISDPNYLTNLKPFIDQYSDNLPSPSSVDAEILLWYELWQKKWDEHWKKLVEQQPTIGTSFSVTQQEMRKLKSSSVPNNIASIVRVMQNFPLKGFYISPDVMSQIWIWYMLQY